MRVVIYIPSISPSSGGVGSFIYAMACELGKLCTLHILTHPGEDEYKLENCIIHYIPYKWKPWNNCKREFLDLLDEIHPDVFHTNCCWTPLSALMAIWAKKHTKETLKVIYSPHGMLEPYAISRHYWTKKLPAILLFQKKGIQSADVIHATGELEKKNILNLGWNSNVTVVPNAIQSDKIPFKFDHVEYKRTKQILFLSRVHPKKGVEILIDAIARLKESFQDYSFIVAGPGEESYITHLIQRCEEQNVASLFHFIGPVFDENKKWELYMNSDLFVLPTYSENFGIVVAESLACGTPVITTNGTPWQDLNDHHCGWCVDVGTDQLAEVLSQFLSCSDTELERMGRNGRELVAEQYDAQVVASSLLHLYRS